MNLLEILREEITKLNITDKLEIARYIYIRTGELFEYDPIWNFGDFEEREEVKNKNIDITNVTDFKIICFSWARMYNELLHKFGIISKVKYTEGNRYDENTKRSYKIIKHAYVEVFINGKIYRSDITATLKDFISIKFGYKTNHNCQAARKFNEINYKYDGIIYDNKQEISSEKLIIDMRKILNSIKNDSEITFEEYVYQVCKLIEQKIDFSKKVGFVIGKIYIEALLNLFVEIDYEFDIMNFFDKNKDIFIAVYEISLKDEIKYFSYEKTNEGFYKFLEISKEKVDFYQQEYSNKKISNEECSRKISEKMLKKIK